MNNQLKIGVILTYINIFFNIIIQIIYIPIILKMLGQSEYGLYSLVVSIVNYLNLFSFGFTASYFRFYSRYAKNNEHNSIYKLNGLFLKLFLVLGTVVFIFGVVCSTFNIFGTKLNIDEIDKAKILMRMLVINLALTFPNSVFDSIIISHERFIFHRIVKLLNIIANPILSFPLLLYGYGSISLVCVTTLVTFVCFFINIYYCIYILQIKFDFSHSNISILQEMFIYSFFIFLNMIIDQINWSLDKFILGHVFGTSSVSIYSVGSQINSLFMLFSIAISSVFIPRVHHIAANGTNMTISSSFTNLFIKVGRIQFIILFFILSCFLFFGKWFIINFYAGKEYTESYYVALLLMIPSTIPLIQNIGIEMQRAVNRHKMRSLIYMVMAIINVIISIPLAKTLGPSGAALGTSISLIIANGLVMNIYYRLALKIDIQMFWLNIISFLKSFILPFILGFIIMKFGNILTLLDFFIYILIYSLLYIFSVYYIGMNKEEKQKINRFFVGLKKIIYTRQFN